ncbi:MAG: hypothetical protein K2P95_09145 [Hyphomonadaceae bacterium]|nr:hypothetical protein [Hyphomonadaceae bacterium]
MQTAHAGGFEAFEAAKWGSLLESLPNACYAQALHLGTTVCEEAKHLALRCGRLLSFQFADPCLDREAVRAAVAGASAATAGGARSADLVIISDLLCVQEGDQLERLVKWTLRLLPVGGHCALLHWAEGSPFNDASEDGVQLFIERTQPRLQPILRRRTPDFRLDILERIDCAA